MTDVSYLLSAADAVRRRSADTAVVFLYLPQPPPSARVVSKTPSSSSSATAATSEAPSQPSEAEEYLKALETLTEEWPPTLMVRGVSPVTSITL